MPAQISVLLACFLSYHGLPLPSRTPALAAAHKLARSPERLPSLYWQQVRARVRVRVRVRVG